MHSLRYFTPSGESYGESLLKPIVRVGVGEITSVLSTFIQHFDVRFIGVRIMVTVRLGLGLVTEWPQTF